ncbi:hypothetical protein [Erythrobacter aureus]|uniref:hypothetical protein n=1 Tax=Erythrobacter aureus TaxID=2182384 RepID=UPI0013B3E8CD|nr:hypothetical protein [Erythrobacter aureus]
MKTFISILIAIIVLILIGDFFRLNAWIARQSVPIGAYVTLYPFPFHIEETYVDGEFQGIGIGESITEVAGALNSNRRCQFVIDERLVEIADANITGYGDGELIMRCKSGGVAWNQILVIQGGVIQQVRISGGLWL